jgi:putative tryptophan/tyrosine transport system substrate-binding protein
VLRRKFIELIGGAAATWPVLAVAQQPAIPVIGLLSGLTPGDAPSVMAAFRLGLADAGYVEGQNVTIEYRWAAGQIDRLQTLAADLVHREVAIIAAISGTPTALAAKAATTTIPVVFAIGSDPVAADLVRSLNRPGGNVTGATFFTGALGAKRLELLLQLAPTDGAIAVLMNPNNPPVIAEATSALNAAQSMGRQARIFSASTPAHLDEAFTVIAQQHFSSLYVSSDAFFLIERDRLVALAARHALPAIYADREITEAGGLINYGASRTDAYRQAGKYTGRILHGDKVGELPVLLPTKFDLVINLKTANALGLTIPHDLLVLADEVLE